MKKYMPYLFIILGFVGILFGGISYTFKEKKEDKKQEEKDNNNENEDIPTVDENIKKEVESYLKTKYNDDFKVIEITKTFCLEDYETNLAITYNKCDDKNIKNEIIKVKDSNNIVFYVKKVSYDESKIKLTRQEDINTQSVGLYDTYINYYMAQKLNKEFEKEYKTIFNKDVKVEIYEGLGIQSLEYSNLYQSLGKDTQNLKDKNMTIQSFASNYSGFGNDLGIVIKLDDSITKDNFQDYVKKINESDFLNNRNYIDIDNLIICFNNDNRYIEYNYNSFIDLKFGKDIYDTFNDNLYDKTIVTGFGFSSNGIKYEEFLNLSKDSFNF